MINFPIVRLKRMSIQLRELTIGQSVALAAIPVASEQAETSAFLRYAVASCQGAVTNPADWTVQERTLAVCQYLAATSEDGPDFSLGTGHYSDYLDGARDFDATKSRVDVGTVGDDPWQIVHLTGRKAEAIERLQGEVADAAGKPIAGRLHWLLGAMAAQLLRKGETEPQEETEGELEARILERMKVFAAFPESDFLALLFHFRQGCRQIAHLFTLDFDDNGIIVLPKEGATANLPPARFSARACLSEGTLGLVQESH